MKNPSSGRRAITIAQRGQIIQRVLVDGWTSAAAAQSFGVPERLVDLWVADYRRDGMASLRHKPGKTIAAEIVLVTFSRPLRAVLRRISIALRRCFTIEPHVQPLPLHRSTKDGSGSGP
jgi:transposase-like protein